jgi:CheY-like chemotaxis protein
MRVGPKSHDVAWHPRISFKIFRRYNARKVKKFLVAAISFWANFPGLLKKLATFRAESAERRERDKGETRTREGNMKQVTKHILIAEDCAEDQLFLKRALERARKDCPHFTFIMVENGLKARHYLKHEEEFSDAQKYPDAALLLTDIKMPYVDGFELLEWVRARKNTARLPVVLMSSSDQEEDVHRAYHLGANTFFRKPDRLSDLHHWASRFTEYWCKLAAVPDA